MAEKTSAVFSDDISVVLCGPAGLGVQTVEQMLKELLKMAGYNVFATKQYMSRVRGGLNSTQIRVASNPVAAPLDRIDILISLGNGAAQHLGRRIGPETLVIAEQGDSHSEPKGRVTLNVDFSAIAANVGNKVYSNVVAAGLLAAVFNIELQAVKTFISKRFASKSKMVVDENLTAAQAGFNKGLELVESGKIRVGVKSSGAVNSDIVVSGGEAVSLGALAGGCNFVSSYPMSPSTPVLTFLAQHSQRFKIVVEQAEDEIAAMNMCIGAWYAGARAMVTTSGGGFALMTEGLSLAAMLETPVVIHLGQRPGPATGLPTRTEQADLELALYAGHGEFPRIIFAPGNLRQCFYLTQTAFNLADKYQVPVFILTDQFLVDSYYNVEPFDLSNAAVESSVVKTEKDYRRYELTGSGISPRGIPGYGSGLVCVDSDEHDAAGHITEDLDLRVKMVDKRLRKIDSLVNDCIAPQVLPQGDYDNLVVCWGSTYHVVKEALEIIAGDDTAMLHFSQVWPIHPNTAGVLKKAKKIISLEQNATGQFAKLLKLHAGMEPDHKILKYSGLQFTVEEAAEKIKQALA